MAASGSGRSGLLAAGGILSIVAGISEIISGVIIAVFLTDLAWFFWFWLPLQSHLEVRNGYIRDFTWVSFPTVPIWPKIIIGILIVAAGIVAVVGGISAIRRYRFGLSLAGAICALPLGLFGIPAVIFISLSKREFGAKA
jgi:hypothetical protein